MPASSLDLTGRSVRLTFAAAGRAELAEEFPSGRFEGEVLAQDDRGLWILVGEKQIGESAMMIPTMLAKWDYIATIAFDYQHAPSGPQFIIELK